MTVWIENLGRRRMKIVKSAMAFLGHTLGRKEQLRRFNSARPPPLGYFQGTFVCPCPRGGESQDKSLVFTRGVVPGELGWEALMSLQFEGRSMDRHVPSGACAVLPHLVTRALVKLRLLDR